MGGFLKLVGILRGEIVDGGVLTTPLRHLRVTLQIGLKTVCDIFTLRDDMDTCGEILENLRHEQRIVGAA